ncbi:MAG: rRNA maturation RNase YbeY [Thiotrichales bacterium]|nr:MAG: rRNA maturation RNase YbeY [Thiotrichales bacterium]
MHDIEVQFATTSKVALPKQKDFTVWANIAITVTHKSVKEITIRIVDSDEMQKLNKTYRNKDSSTNVLAFPCDEANSNYLGDIVICAATVEKEATEQNKSLMAHFAHLTIHGCLHLLGYEHQNDAQAQKMETLEIELLKTLNYTNPYNQT